MAHKVTGYVQSQHFHQRHLLLQATVISHKARKTHKDFERYLLSTMQKI